MLSKIVFLCLFGLALSQNVFQQYNPFGQQQRPPPQPQTSSAPSNSIQAMGEDPVMTDGFDLKGYLCQSCRFLTAVAKRYYQQEPNNQKVVDFLQAQKYYDDLIVSLGTVGNLRETNF
jgi:hypothetical protein